MKKVPFATKPSSQTADDWVKARTVSIEPSKQEDQEKGEGMKRLTIDVSTSLHRRIKMQCAARDVKIADEVRGLLERHFPATPGEETQY